jgi:hypothetical protein
MPCHSRQNALKIFRARCCVWSFKKHLNNLLRAIAFSGMKSSPWTKYNTLKITS